MKVTLDDSTVVAIGLQELTDLIINKQSVVHQHYAG